MEKTVNYQLNQWDAADPIRREDFNSDNAAIDAALAELGETAAALAAGLGSGGKTCRMAFGTYQGTGVGGSANPTRVTVDFYPVLVLVGKASGSSTMYWPSIFMRPGISGANNDGRGITVGWSDNGVQWYGEEVDQNNYAGTAYAYVVIGYSA